MINYKKLIDQKPFVYGELLNSLGQTIQFVECPKYGDEAEVICVCHELELASYSTFMECDDMEENHREYEPSFKEDKFQIGGYDV